MTDTRADRMSDRPKVFEGIDWANGRDRGYHVVTIGPDATPEDVQAFRDAYELGCAWAAAEAALPEGWWIAELALCARNIHIIGHASEHIDWWSVTASGPKEAEEQADAPTPPAALRALAERLRERTG